VKHTMADNTTSVIYNLSISARATYNLHSLNNEGGEGNQIQTRMVNLMSQDGRLAQVNAISGDMFKHIQAEHAYLLARDGGYHLCKGCEIFDANRINGDAEFLKRTGGNTNVQLIDNLLTTCTLDDLEGILITEGKRSVSRTSVVEFAWVAGIPDEVRTDQFFHVKYNPQACSKSDKDKNKKENGEDVEAADTAARIGTGATGQGQGDGSNRGQAIFHRPASSGNYALVVNLEAGRIGYNDISQKYALDEAERTRRLRLMLQSLLYTFIQPNGAMRGTQLPHLVDMEGVITVSRGILPAPNLSPLNSDYRNQLSQIVASLNELPPSMFPPTSQPTTPTTITSGGNTNNGRKLISAYSFDSLADFTSIMAGLVSSAVPYTFQVRSASGAVDKDK
jgi:CRISPR-associated protein Cst2